MVKQKQQGMTINQKFSSGCMFQFESDSRMVVLSGSDAAELSQVIAMALSFQKIQSLLGVEVMKKKAKP